MSIEQPKIALRPAWNTGCLIGPKPPLKPRQIWLSEPGFSTINGSAILRTGWLAVR